MNHSPKRWAQVCLQLFLCCLVLGCVEQEAPAPCSPEATPRTLPPWLLVTQGDCNWRPAWSPDSSEIVFDNYAGPGCWPDSEALFRRSLDGWKKVETVLPVGTLSRPRAPAWAPQGDWIAFYNYDTENPAAGGLYIIRPDGTDLTHLANEGNDPAWAPPTWSPDGEWIAFAGDVGTGVYKVRRDGTTKLQLFSLPGTFDLCMNVTWSPDGTRLAYACRTGGETRGAGASNVYVSRADGSGTVNLTENTPLVAEHPAWAPEGDRIAFSVNLGARGIYLINPDGSGLVRLTQGEAHEVNPTWSPDGRQIMFLTDTALGVVQADGSDRRVLFDLPCVTQEYSWSPDGIWSAFSCEYWSQGEVPAAVWIYLVQVNPEAP